MRALLAAFALFLSSSAFASWHYNEDGGFGIYQPEGWNVRHEGRSSTLSGPATDSAQSELFLGSDWSSRAKDLRGLELFAREESGSEMLTPITISNLPGFRSGDEMRGWLFVLRIPENVIVVHYDLRGSRAQIEEGQTMLGSIEIRTRGIEN